MSHISRIYVRFDIMDLNCYDHHILVKHKILIT